MDIVTAFIRSFEEWDVLALQNTINKAKQKKQSVLPIMINSYGGSVYGLFQMIDSLDASGLKIVTILNGFAMSAGAFLFARGDERYMSANSTIMIHEASFFAIGKQKEIESVTNHVKELNDKAFALMDLKANKPDNYFKDLYYKENKGADTYLNAQQSLEHGLVTEIRIPDLQELITKEKSSNILSEYQNFKLLMDLSNENIKPIKEVKTLDLKTIMSSLTAEQQAPILALQSELSTAKSELLTINASVSSLTQKISEKETEIVQIKTEHEKQLSEIEDKQDKDFINSLVAKKQLAQADVDSELKTLKSLSAIPEAKKSYKDKLIKASSVVGGEIPNNGENEFDLSGSNPEDKLNIIAKKNNLDLNKTQDLIKAQKLLAIEIGGKK